MNLTALAEHSLRCKHTFDFNANSKLGQHKILDRRLLHAILEIKLENISLKKRTDNQDFNTVYYNLRDKIRK